MNDSTTAYFDHLERCPECSPFAPCAEGRRLCDVAMKDIAPKWATPVEEVDKEESNAGRN